MTSPYDMSDETPVYVLSVAAQLSGFHPQTLRAYDRLGLVSPGRSTGRGRRYSMRDVLALREVQRLSQAADRRPAQPGRAAPGGAGIHPERGRTAGRPAQEGPGRPGNGPGPQRPGCRLGTGRRIGSGGHQRHR